MKYLKPITTAVFGVAIFLFWLFCHLEMMNYHEQNQLFLFTSDYLLADLRTPGGMADYVSEFIVQFYYVPWIGALLIALTLSLMQWLMWKTVAKHDGRLFILTFLLPLAALWNMGDIDSLLSLPVAVNIVLATVLMMRRVETFLPKGKMLADIIIVPVLYWLAGPAAWAYVLIRSIDSGWRRLLLSSAVLLAFTFFAHWLVGYQLPLGMMFTGVNYYRIPQKASALQLVVPFAAVVLTAVARLTSGKRIATRVSAILQSATVIVIGWLSISDGFDPYVNEILWQDSMVRQSRWQEIIQRAEKHQLDEAFSSECVNLALGMTGQLADRMFYFKQSGPDALLLHSVRDNMSDYPTAEAFYQLGMINSALRYMFDIQQSILNFRKSGRCTKRIAECYIINGNYKAAEKHLNLLRHSLFYSDWAEDASTYLYNDNKVECHKTWGKLRRYRYKDRMLFSYPEKHKMLGLLFMNNTSNRLALSYFMGQLLLDGSFNEFMGYMQWVQQYGGYNSMPYGYADAVQAIQQQGNVPGSAYARYVNKMMQQHGKN